MEHYKKTGELKEQDVYKWPKEPTYFNSSMLVKVEIKEYWRAEINIKETEYFWDKENFHHWGDMIEWAKKHGMNIKMKKRK